MHTYKKIMAIACTMAAVWLSMPMAADAGGASVVRKSDRERTWDFYLPLTYAEETTIDGQQGSSVEIDDGFGIGFGVGYNFNDHFQLGGLFNWSYRSYDATAVREDGSTQQVQQSIWRPRPLRLTGPILSPRQQHYAFRVRHDRLYLCGHQYPGRPCHGLRVGMTRGGVTSARNTRRPGPKTA